jgi:uncharacterized protein (TIGR03083 family)
MSSTVVDTSAIEPLSHSRAMDLQSTELERSLEMLEDFEPDDWKTRTECPDWDVHHMYLHVLGACEGSVSIRENLHQMSAARKHQKAHGGPLEAALSHVQVTDRHHMSPEALLGRLVEIAPITVRKRSRMPAPVRAIRLGIDGPVVEKWKLGYLVDTIYLRDLWMHRVDASVATGRDVHLTPDHDGVIVADVVAEWARRHGRPFELRLTGPAGGAFTSPGAESPDRSEIVDDIDAVEFCRVLAGRLPATHPLLETIVPF